jgi:hypothetical protein
MWKKTAAIAIAVMAALLLLLSLSPGWSLVIEDGQGMQYFSKDVSPGDVVSLGFTHSVEKVPVIDTFVIDRGGALLLVNTTYGSTGAGLPSEGCYNISTDGHGNFTIENIDATFDKVNFITGPLPRHNIVVSGKNYPIYSSVPEEEPLILRVKRKNIFDMVINAIRA